MKVDAKNPMKGGGGKLNFATADDKMAMTVFVPPESMYALWERQYPGIAIAGLGGMKHFRWVQRVCHQRSYFVDVKQAYRSNC